MRYGRKRSNCTMTCRYAPPAFAPARDQTHRASRARAPLCNIVQGVTLTGSMPMADTELEAAQTHHCPSRNTGSPFRMTPQVTANTSTWNLECRRLRLGLAYTPCLAPRERWMPHILS